MIGPPDLRGLWGFALTPFDAADRVDEAVFRAGLRGLVDGGADVVIACGTLGQGDRMSPAERVACLAMAADEVAGARPLIGVLIAEADPSEEAVAARAAGADGVLLLPSSGRVADAAATITAIARATGGRLPVVLYQRAALRLAPADLVALAEQPALIGLKDAHGDLRAFRRLREVTGERLAWIGAAEDLAVAYLTHGADAVAPASMAYAPAYARGWRAAVAEGDVAGAIDRLRRFIWPLTDLRLSRPAIDLTVVRDMARLLGRPAGALRPPAQALTADETTELERLARVLRDELGADATAEPAGVAAPEVATRARVAPER